MIQLNNFNKNIFYNLKNFIYFTLSIYFFLDFSAIAKSTTFEINSLLSEQQNNIQKPLDIESLGLDNIDKSTDNSKSNILPNNSLKPSSEINTIEDKNLTNNSLPKINNKTKYLNPNVKKNVKKKSEKPLLNLRQKLELEESKIKEQEQEKNKNLRYENVRNLYLKDLLEKDLDLDEDLQDNDIVKPHPKSLAPFLLDELPALPILNRSRSQDNYHIPYVYTPKEYIDIMFSAISLGSVSYFNEAFKYVLNPNITNDQGDTILTYSIYLKKYSIMASILAKGADPNLPNQLGHLPVSIAIELNDFVALEMLAKANADLKYRDLFGRTFLMQASRLGFLPGVDLLIKSNVDINEMDNDGFTALAFAYRFKKELVVQYLLKNGAKTWVERPYNPQFKSFIKELNNRWN
jgi:ankyrin repeat protein